MDECNILFVSAGRRVSLIRHFKQTLTALGWPGKIVTADVKRNAPAHFVADEQEIVPRVSDPAYIPALFEVCERHRIQLLVPLIDTELTLLAEHKEEFRALGVEVLVSSPEVNRISFDKRHTHDFFRKIGVDTPELLDPKQILADPHAAYPVLLKPATGSSSVGVTKIEHAQQLEFFMEHVPHAIVQEFVQGEEYTLDVLVDFTGQVRSVVPRLRMETRAGEVSKGMTVKNHELMQAAKHVVEALPGAVGCITVQCFLTAEGEVKFIEINPRFGGGIPLSLAAGADFPRWILQMMRGQTPEFAIDQWEDGIVMLRYDDAIFLRREQIQ